MDERFSRMELLLGERAAAFFADKKIAVFGIGGVGGFVVEGLARCGIGHFLLVDHDEVALSNINRQIIATDESIGRLKVEVMKERIKAINPSAEVETKAVFFLPENRRQFQLERYDYIIDAVDTVTAKLELISLAKELQVPIISCMGVGNKLYPQQLAIARIEQTSVCPLAKVMRRELKKRGLHKVKVLYSTEPPIRAEKRREQVVKEAEASSRRSLPGSISFVPSVAGLMIAGEVIRDLSIRKNC
ncbi:MAG: tRNA threonylcarbamoyladenosine dehydratase [Eubacteriales bacterium]|nr:tRNA threonylcarbamoyladenosine dehydratase [Eubacteriales bacterium]